MVSDTLEALRGVFSDTELCKAYPNYLLHAIRDIILEKPYDKVVLEYVCRHLDAHKVEIPMAFDYLLRTVVIANLPTVLSSLNRIYSYREGVWEEPHIQFNPWGAHIALYNIWIKAPERFINNTFYFTFRGGTELELDRLNDIWGERRAWGKLNFAKDNIYETFFELENSLAHYLSRSLVRSHNDRNLIS